MRAAKGEGSGFKAKTGSNKGKYRGYVTVNSKRVYTPWLATKTELAQAKRELLNRRDDGKLIAGKKSTVEQWMMHWFKNVRTARPTTDAMDLWVIEQRIIPALGKQPIDKLTAEAIEQWAADLGIAVSSQRRYLAPMKTALEVAYMRGHIPFNPAARVKLGPQAKANTSAFSREDRDALLRAATGRNRARWHIGLRLGLRPAEMLGLSWPDFDQKAGTLTIRNQLLRATGKGLYLQPAPKTDAGEREILLPKTLAKLLVEHRREQLLERAQLADDWMGWDFEGQPVALVFTQPNGKPIGARTDILAWQKLLTAAGLSTVRRYKGRHTAATHMLNDSGNDVAVTAKILGHSDGAFTYRVYVHPLEEREREMAARMDAPAPAPYAAPYDLDDVIEADINEGDEPAQRR